MSDNGLPAKLERVDPGKLKLRELVEVEKAVGRRIAGELQSGDLGMDTMQALLWVTMRRANPDITPEMVGEYDMETLMGAFGDDEKVDDGLDPSMPATRNGHATSGGSPDVASSKPTPSSTTSGG